MNKSLTKQEKTVINIALRRLLIDLNQQSKKGNRTRLNESYKNTCELMYKVVGL